MKPLLFLYSLCSLAALVVGLLVLKFLPGPAAGDAPNQQQAMPQDLQTHAASLQEQLRASEARAAQYQALAATLNERLAHQKENQQNPTSLDIARVGVVIIPIGTPQQTTDTYQLNLTFQDRTNNDLAQATVLGKINSQNQMDIECAQGALIHVSTHVLSPQPQPVPVPFRPATQPVEF